MAQYKWNPFSWKYSTLENKKESNTQYLEHSSGREENIPLNPNTSYKLNKLRSISSGETLNSNDRSNISSKRKQQISIGFLGVMLAAILVSMVMVLVTTTNMIMASPFCKRFHGVTTTAEPSREHIDFRQGVIQPAGETHELPYNAEARRASKKLYELLSDFDTAFYDSENMILGTTLFTENVYSRQPHVANGYIGNRVPNIGFGFAYDALNFWSNASGALDNGWPLRNQRFAGSFLSDFYCLEPKLNSTNFPELDDKGYPTVISSIPEWSNLQFSLNGSWFNTSSVHNEDVLNYNQNVSMKDGIVTTEMDWYNGMVHVRSEIWAHRRIHPLAVMSLEVTLNEEHLPDDFDQLDIDIHDILDHATSMRTVLQDLQVDDKNSAIYMIVQPDNVPDSNAAIYSTCIVADSHNVAQNNFEFGINSKEAGKVSQISRNILSRENPSITVTKHVGMMSTEFKTEEHFLHLSNLDVARNIALNAKGQYESLLSSHKRAWYDLYNDAFIEIPSDALLEMTARSSLYQLLANTRTYNVSERGLPVGVGGLSSDSYGGMVFWDADIWMAPALLPFFPEVSKNMNNYRNSTHKQAQLNAQEAGYPGAVYPWTSGRFANCTSTGPCIDYEYHINVDVALASFSIYLNGAAGIDDDYLRYTTWPMVRDAAQFFTSFVKYNATFDRYETHNLTDPDEFADHIDNGAFTNAGIKTLLKWATDIGNHLEEKVDPKWPEISEKIYIPRSPSNITLEYSGMNSSVEIKQADVTLMVYPLGYINDESILMNAIKDLYYYSERQSASGPAMTYPVFVAAAAGLLNHGSSSQSYLYKSVLPYLRQPFAQFSEQSDDNFLTNGLTQPAFPFLTANGGFLQSILFGLTGIRYSYDTDPETKKMSRVMRFNPIQLPLMPGGLAIRNFKYLNQVLDIIIDDNNGTIVHKSGDQPITILVPNRDLIHDRDINVYRRNSSYAKRDLFSREEMQIEKSQQKNVSGTYYTLHPNEELVLPLFKPGLNIENNVAENQQITNLTAGVPGDVAFSVLDGNNYTHWQPLTKASVGKLLIDLGRNNEKDLRHGTILWGQRPAKNVSISILPHNELIEEIFSNVTYILENSQDKDPKKTIEELVGNYVHVNPDNKDCVSDVLTILNWKMDNVDEVIKQMPDIGLIHETFVTIVDNLEIEPNEPYYDELIRNSQIELLPSNMTVFDIDYSKADFSNTLKCFNSGNEQDMIKARYIVVSVQGTYDEDEDTKGATIKEVAFGV
ncbi:alpha,alpha-trehalase ATH1 KNAG_0C03300 [Huiozyma naganishii CBS 8797]|uniref:alpha,alpha-trehalase n=1 Tax=Huiozyma naganishii (strain ATCC MYA-139 / BCRC 22969 / CBS 8797 / KCTC 17520 / NBRC 10181 / NCYC 3082 / Yp74L-3) TaxID=1071383 RepID=J7RIT4_HUIN7|nr:hypothetical protein KNAG_0C03300 [Kazachstania naganishii CBS 8797]CCK69438.1 hypothetical protein KNAG_0C03300 [Kazachstania naganishii CBS 8797]